MYILKQLFFSISVNSGFGNIYLAAFAARQIFCHYSPRFQRIIVKYTKVYPSMSSPSPPISLAGREVGWVALKGRLTKGVLPRPSSPDATRSYFMALIYLYCHGFK